MQIFFKTLWKIANKILKSELNSTSGKVNLLGGIVITLLVGAIFIKDVLTIIFNFILLILGKTAMPDISTTALVASIFGVIAYFYLCVRVINTSNS